MNAITPLVQDMNGDGYDDVIVGAWGASSGAGEVMVIFGGSTFEAVVTASNLNGVGGFLIRGATTSDAAGFSVAAGGVRVHVVICTVPVRQALVCFDDYVHGCMSLEGQYFLGQDFAPQQTPSYLSPFQRRWQDSTLCCL